MTLGNRRSYGYHIRIICVLLNAVDFDVTKIAGVVCDRYVGVCRLDRGGQIVKGDAAEMLHSDRDVCGLTSVQGTVIVAARIIDRRLDENKPVQGACVAQFYIIGEDLRRFGRASAAVCCTEKRNLDTRNICCIDTTEIQ